MVQRAGAETKYRHKNSQSMIFLITRYYRLSGKDYLFCGDVNCAGNGGVSFVDDHRIADRIVVFY